MVLPTTTTDAAAGQGSTNRGAQRVNALAHVGRHRSVTYNRRGRVREMGRTRHPVYCFQTYTQKCSTWGNARFGIETCIPTCPVARTQAT